MNARSLPRIVVVVLMVALAAGCLELAATSDDPAPSGGASPDFDPVTPPAPDFDFSTVVDPDHGAHAVPDLHTAGHGLSLVGHTGVGDVLPPGVQGSITSIDVLDGWAVVPGMQGEMGFVLVNLEDPSNPHPVGWYRSVADGWTARFSHDGNYVFYGCQMMFPSTSSSGRGDCVDPDAVRAPSSARDHVVVVDVTDKANPVFVDAVPVSGWGAHNLHATVVDGVDVVVTGGVQVIEFDRDAGKLAVVAEVPGVHDATVMPHPGTGDLYLFTGSPYELDGGTGVGGFAIYDLNDPRNPVPVFEGRVGDVIGWHEQTPFPTLIDGRWILAAGGETLASTEGRPDAVFLVDVTDPSDPRPVSAWRPPFTSAAPWASYLFSVHEMAVTPTGQLAVSWYHAGAWVLDVSTGERLAEPVILGAYQPHEEVNVLPGTFWQIPEIVVPYTWSVNWDARGYLVVPDMHTGVYVLEPEWGLVPGIDGGRGYR